VDSGCIQRWNIAIQPLFQDRGIGQSVLKTLQQVAVQRGLPLKLRLFPTNPRAQRFYERLGFSEIGRTRTGIEMKMARRLADQRSVHRVLTHQPAGPLYRYCAPGRRG